MERAAVPSAKFQCEPNCDSHFLAHIKCPKTAVCFAMCLELPIPWDQILYHHEKVFLQRALCGSVELEVCSVFNKMLQPDFSSLTSRWSVHCHCPDKQSLQCFAGKKVVLSFIEQILKGTMYNQMFWNYRAYVNRGMHETLIYVGSYYIRGVHYVVIRALLDSDMARIRMYNFGEAVFVNGLYGNFLILICRSCNLTELQARVCARRTRRVLKRALCCCCGPKVASKKELLRQKELARMLKYGVSLTQRYVKYL